MFEDTIAGISTAFGESAISIIRISGSKSIEIINSIFTKNLTEQSSHTIHYGKIVDPDENSIVDEVLVSLFKAPKTYTREDIIEINCHGGIYATEKILEIVLNQGARIAEPGEFTKRSFLNGRIDLVQAESIMDIIHSKTEESLVLANKGLDGKLSLLIKTLREKILDIIAHIEVNIDYPEYDDVIEMTNTDLFPKMEEIINEMDIILEASKTGKVIREGIKTAIIGRPNVGKSSLLNNLLQEDKAIVTHIEGTTRDIVEGEIKIGGIVLHLIDTAGIRKTDNVIEEIGIEKSKKMIDEAELILFVLNGNEELTEEDIDLYNKVKNKNHIVLVNKSDLEQKINYVTIESNNILKISALNDVGFKELNNKIKKLFQLNKIGNKDLTYLSNSRHIHLLKESKKSLKSAINNVKLGMPIDIAEVDIKNAWDYLGEILGDSVKDELLDELFSKFCLGK
ncbi:tRNA uridine-5-carboxymethylaminomethyl(34) synthesis GTPase MnmE [Culicoidibacter larvae]|uniref:tRNA modification GTPase MnmE n=1 Tax=Culicoidibacter larvae TaxID=2579976 RepID=A0A5R8QGR8_9FIRM|nr:tRNA uridine-5-carboxymethylaminomethyl(34) synthesis GTPase MnmE [Culicoidibacter larvae]TLG77172.1 tRNA uridine-5-carboxymethylaminomethyl(34) synthesis GTPase MnmE [Culicoidibacter larvae]